MDRPNSDAQASLLRKPPHPLGTAPTIMLMLGLCAPLGGYTAWLLDRHSPAVSLAALSPLELLPAIGLLALPFVALKLLRVDWQAER
jgi:hypothetical protein